MSKEQQLLKKIEQLEAEVLMKNNEITRYQKELLKFSQNLDMLLSSTQNDVNALSLMQQAIVPTELPQFVGYEISRKFSYGSRQGGDYFDLFSFVDKMKFAVLLASSSSYTMSAAFLSAVLQNTASLEGRQGWSMEEVVSTLASELLKISSGKDETQLFYGVFDRREMEFRFCCVGQIRGYIISPTNDKNNVIKILSSTTPGIKIGQSNEYASVKIDLKPGDRLCFISEGLLNILDNTEIVQAMQQTIEGTVHDLRNQIFIQAQLKSGLDRPLKDQTVIVVEIKDNIVRLANK